MSAYPPVAPNSTVRRMRRSRDVVGSSGEGDFQSGYDLYSIQGDAAGALKVFQQQQQQKRQQNLDETNKADNFKDNVSLASKYNCMLLSQIASKKKKTVSQQSKEVLLSKLDELDALFVIAEKEKQKDEEKLSGPRKLVPNDFILVYNRMLVLHSTGDVRVCAQLCFEKISSIIDHFQNKSDNTTKDIDAEKHRQITSSMLLSDDVAVVVARIAFLLLECILCISVGRNGGLKSITSSIGIPSVEIILDWLESLPVVNSGTSGGSNLDSQNKDPQLKFLFNLYKSRLALADLDVNTGKHVEANIRSARKDMKTAMEVFQQKLRPSIGTETASVVSSVNSEENVSLNGSSNNRQDSQSAFPSNVVLQKLNQSALSLKAHLEQLKGNTKKSLILCSEAVGVDESTSINVGYDAVHSNNLAVIYETNDKRHLALHALAKSLRATSIENGSPSDENDKNINDNDQDSSRSSLFYSDGTVRPKMTLSILHNAAICSLRARNYLSAYECIATCVTKSEIFYNRPTSWLRMAESCIGIWTINRRSTHGSKFDTVSIEGEPQGIIIGSAMFSDDEKVLEENLMPVLASREDMEQVQRNPLLRARACLNHALRYEKLLNNDTLLSTWLSTAYVSLAFGEYNRALNMATLVLDSPVSLTNTDEVSICLRKRQLATARMYAAEASCALGELVKTMKFLVGDGNEDAFNRLASDLGGVTLETASTNEKGKRRLAKAQTMVRSSACSVTAAMGNPQAAKQLANSANAMEDAYSVNRERSSSRRALIYTLLQEGHQSSALHLLLSHRP